MARIPVGILLNAAVHRGIPALRTGQESLDNYEAAAAACGLVPCFLRLDEIDVQSGHSAAYIKSPQGYRRTVIPTPGVIHNRAIYRSGHSGLRRLTESGPSVFNTSNRYPKDFVHRLLEKSPALSAHMPVTATGVRGLAYMMERYDDLILKPAIGSVGHGIMRLQRQGGERSLWTLSYMNPGAGSAMRETVFRHSPPAALLARLAAAPYLVQERIALAECAGRSFDLRVTVQKGWGGEWRITGMFAKLAPAGGFVSNIARGGEAVPAALALEERFPGRAGADIRRKVAELTLAVANTLDGTLGGLADLGLDIGVSGDGGVFFIECNGRDQRYGFRKAGMSREWMESYWKPMGYARYLAERRALTGRG